MNNEKENNLKDKIWNKIKKKNIKPHSKYYFQIQELFWWTLIFIFIFISSIALSSILLEFLNADWDLYNRIFQNFFTYFFKIIPLTWFLLFIIFIIFSIFYYYHTKNAYKHSYLKTSIFILFFISVISIIFYYIGFSHFIHRYSYQHLPQINQKYLYKRNCLWKQYDKGFLGGQLIKIKDSKTIEIIDLNKKKWIVDIEKAKILNKDQIYINSLIKIIGKIKNLNKHYFKAFEIRPWNTIHYDFFNNNKNNSIIFIINEKMK